MIDFDVNDMTCGHCAAAITRALEAADPGARVHIDLARRRVSVEPAATGPDGLSAAIAGAGYTPVPAAAAAAPAAGPRCAGGCACR